MTTKKQNYALPIAMMFALFFMVAFVTGLPAPLGVIVQNQFGASNFAATLGFAANFIAYAFMGLPAGMMLQKIGYKKTALLAVVVGFTGVAIQFLSGQLGSFTVYLAGAFVSGFSMCMLNTVVNPMLNTLGGGGNKGNQLIQIGGSMNSVAATFVPVLVGYLMGANVAERTIEKANPALFIALAIFAVVFVVLLIMDIPEPRLAVASKVKNAHSPLAFRHFIFGAICIFVYVGIEIGIPQFVSLYLTSKADLGGLGIDAAVAGSVVGTYWFCMMLGRIFGASLASKFSARTMLSAVSSTGLVFALIAIFGMNLTTVSMPVFQSDISFAFYEVPIGVMFLVLCGFCTSVMWGGIFNLAVEGLGKYTEQAAGLFMVMVCGGGLMPLLQGYIADVTVSFSTSYWVVAAGLAYMLFYAQIGSKNVNKNIPV